MSDFNLLRRMIHENAIIEAKKTNGGQLYLKLEEKSHSNSSGYSIELHNIPDDCIAVKSDDFPAPQAFFKREKGQCRRSDYVVLAKYRERKWRIYIELKSGKSERSRIIQQLKGSQCLFEYCRCLGRSFWQSPAFLESADYCSRFVSLRVTSMNKSGSRNRRHPAHDTPDTMLTLAVRGRIFFKQLL